MDKNVSFLMTTKFKKINLNDILVLFGIVAFFIFGYILLIGFDINTFIVFEALLIIPFSINIYVFKTKGIYESTYVTTLLFMISFSLSALIFPILFLIKVQQAEILKTIILCCLLYISFCVISYLINKVIFKREIIRQSKSKVSYSVAGGLGGACAILINFLFDFPQNFFYYLCLVTSLIANFCFIFSVFRLKYFYKYKSEIIGIIEGE